MEPAMLKPEITALFDEATNAVSYVVARTLKTPINEL